MCSTLCVFVYYFWFFINCALNRMTKGDPLSYYPKHSSFVSRNL